MNQFDYYQQELAQKKMEQWYQKTHKIYKQPKNEDKKKIKNKVYLQLFDDNTNKRNLHQSNSKKTSLMQNELNQNSKNMKQQQIEITNTHSLIVFNEERIKTECVSQNDINSQNLALIPRNNQNQLLKLVPKFLYEPQDQRSFCIYNDIVIDFDLLEDQNYIYQKQLTQALSSFKKVKQINKLNNGDFIEVQQESYSSPLKDYSFLLNKLSSLNSTESYKWFQFLSIFQQKSQHQVNYLNNLKAQYDSINRIYEQNQIQENNKISQQSQVQNSNRIQDIFYERKKYAQQIAQKYIKTIPRNQYFLYVIYHFDFNSMSSLQTSTGYSRKLLDIMGLSIQDAPSVFIRKGPLDLINKKIHTLNQLLANIQLIGHPKKDIIDIAEGETFIHTLDNFQLQANLHIKTINLTHQFDSMNKLDLPINDDMLIEIKYEIDEENLSMFQQKRKEKNILGSFSVYDIIDGEFEYLMEVENFLQKYYETNLSSSTLSKKRAQQQNKLNQMFNQITPIKKQSSQEISVEFEAISDSGPSSRTICLSDQSYNSSNPFDSYLKPCEIKKDDYTLDKSVHIKKANIVNLLDDTNPSLLA